jgi:hypothetical protein
LVAISILPGLVANGTKIIPEVAEIDALTLDDVSIASVVFDELVAMATVFWAYPGSLEPGWLSLDEIQQCIMSRIEILAASEPVFHRDSNPMSEPKTLVKFMRKS